MRATFLISFAALALTLAACGGDTTTGEGSPEQSYVPTGPNNSPGPGAVIGAPSGTVDAGETAHLVFMREEEKLARDVYLTFAAWYPEYRVFQNIATRSEQTHTDTMLALLQAYGIADPSPQTNDLPDSIGVFEGKEYGAYFEKTFEALTTAGAKSALDALYVGALIEELDMDDIVHCPHEIVDQDNGIGEGECGQAHTDNSDIASVYTQLLEGSQNHLNAFVRGIEAVEGAGSYQAQYLTQLEVDAILGR